MVPIRYHLGDPVAGCVGVRVGLDGPTRPRRQCASRGAMTADRTKPNNRRNVEALNRIFDASATQRMMVNAINAAADDLPSARAVTSSR
jgi:hypothetical protein